MIRIFVLTAMLLAAGSSLFAESAKGEVRGFWAEGFNASIHTPEQVDTLVERLQASNTNAIWQQFRKRGDAHYRSTYELWARENPQHFDALQYLIDKAHAAEPRIEVHAWLNTCAVGGELRPGHILQEHPEYVSISDEGVDYDNEAMKIDPGHPGANDWTFRVYMDVVRNYDVDGVHFDFVRYGNPRWGFNPVSVALFNKTHGRTGKPAWDDPEFQQWRRDAVSALVRKVYAHTKAIKPEVKVSAATIGWGNGPTTMEEYHQSAPYARVYQDWVGWMEEGILDINCPMMYFDNQRYREYWLNWIEWCKNNKYSRNLVIGQGIWLNSIEDTLLQIEDSRKPSGQGEVEDGLLLYSYASTNADPEGGPEQRFNPEFYHALSNDTEHGPAPFPEPMPFPELKAGIGGIVKGFVHTSPWLAPVVGAEVTLRRAGAGPAMKTDVTGFWAFIGVPPGNYTLEVKAPNLPGDRREVAVEDGAVTTVNSFLGAAGGGSVESPLTVFGGNDRFDGVVYLWNPITHKGRKLRVRADTPLPYQRGDVVAVSAPSGVDPVIRLVDIDNGFNHSFALGLWKPDVAGLRDSRITTGYPVELTGTVARLVEKGFVLKSGSSEVEVTARDLKPEYRFTVTSGRSVTVSGVVDKTDGLRVCPLGPEDVRETS